MANRHVVAFVISQTPVRLHDLTAPGQLYSGKKIRAAITHLIETRLAEVAEGVLYQVIRKSYHPPPSQSEPRRIWASPWHAVTLNRLPLYPSLVHLLKDD